LQYPPKFTQIGIFGSKTNHLATLLNNSSEMSSFGTLVSWVYKALLILILPREQSQSFGIHGEGPTYRGLTFPTGFACGGSVEEEEEVAINS
jgi:hypothetical protein